MNFSIPLLIFENEGLSINFCGTWEDFVGYTLIMKDSVTLNANDKVTIVDMGVKQAGQALPLVAVDDEKFMYQSITLNTNTADIEITGKDYAV